MPSENAVRLAEVLDALDRYEKAGARLKYITGKKRIDAAIDAAQKVRTATAVLGDMPDTPKRDETATQDTGLADGELDQQYARPGDEI